MIHHLSVSARDPNAVADFFAELIGGVSVDFPPNPGSRMVFKADGHGTAVEIYPAGSVMAPNGDPGAVFVRQPVPVEAGAVARSPTHFAISVDRSAEAIQALAEARGWACYICDRGGHFHVVEVWIENAWLVEALPPDLRRRIPRLRQCSHGDGGSGHGAGRASASGEDAGDRVTHDALPLSRRERA